MFTILEMFEMWQKNSFYNIIKRKKRSKLFQYLCILTSPDSKGNVMSITYALMILHGDVDQARVAERRHHPQPPCVYIFF